MSLSLVALKALRYLLECTKYINVTPYDYVVILASGSSHRTRVIVRQVQTKRCGDWP